MTGLFTGSQMRVSVSSQWSMTALLNYNQQAMCSWSDWEAGLKTRCLVVSWMSPNRPVTRSNCPRQYLIITVWASNSFRVGSVVELGVAGGGFKTSHCSKSSFWPLTGSCAFSHEAYQTRCHPKWLAVEEVVKDQPFEGGGGENTEYRCSNVPFGDAV